LLSLDQKRHFVLFIAAVAFAIVELGLLVVINFRRLDQDTRNEGSFFYVFFRHYYLLNYFLLYLPSAYLIEIVGVNKSITLGMILCTSGLWFMYAAEYTSAIFLIGISFPFVVNTSTTISGRWYGPKGRNIATGILLLSLFIPVGVEVIMGEGFENSLSLVLPILSTIWTLICFLLIYDRPKFCPTMSEEDKSDLRRRYPKSMTFKSQLMAMKMNKGFLLIAGACICMLVNVNEINRVLMIFYRNLNSRAEEKIITIIEALHKICQITGVLTFAVALFGGLSLRFGFKILVFQFLFIFILQGLSMLAKEKTFLIVTNLYDGLFAGGLVIIFSEVSAELAYPVGESISLGLINAGQSLVRFIIKFTVDILTFTEQYDEKERKRN
jgi:hypothetical protein